MAFLAIIPLDADFTTRVTWTPAASSPDPSGASLTFVHETEGDVIGPLAATADGVNTWKVSTSLSKGGRWRVRWTTTPPGGSTNDVLYVQ